MDWTNERYIRVYTRETPEWVSLEWEERALFDAIMRKVDRAGLIKIGRAGTRGLAALVRMPADVVERSLPALVADGCVELRDGMLVLPNFIEAQEARQSDAQRARDSRARRRDAVLLDVEDAPPSSHGVTPGHTTSHDVTPNCAVPSCAVPNQIESARPARMREVGVTGTPMPIPPGLSLSDESKAYAETQGVQDIEAEWEKFKAHYLAAGTLAVDWQAGFRKWAINAAKFQRRDRERERDREASGAARAPRGRGMKQPGGSTASWNKPIVAQPGDERWDGTAPSEPGEGAAHA